MARSGFPYIPVGILTEILKSLCVKIILRFQSVCKAWYDLFKTKYFIDQHRTHNAQENPLLLLHSYDREYKNPSLRLLNPHLGTVESLRIPHIDSFMQHGWTIVGSCNGLLCVELKNDDRDILLWNPAINEVREVPRIRNCYYSYRCSVGFGFSRVVNDYKIVRFYHKDLDASLEFTNRDGAAVFSLNTGLWKELEFEGLDHIKCFATDAFNVNGIIFWWGFLHYYSPILISFDIATEVFKLISLPAEDSISVFRSLYGFGVYENKLVGHYAIKEGPESHFIFVLAFDEVASESGSSLSCIQRYMIGPISNVFCPECYWRNEVVFWEKNDPDQVEDDPMCVVYMVNLNTTEWRRFNCSIDFQCDWCDTFNYTESLVSVGNNQVE